MDSTATNPLLSSRADAVVPLLVAVLAAAALAVLGDVAVTALATNAVGVQYRFQVVGLFYAAMPQLMALTALIAAVAIYGGRRGVLRGAAIASVAMGIVALLLMAFFGLDLLESRRTVAQSNVHGFTLAALKTAGFAGLLALLAIWAGWREIAASAKGPGGEPRSKGQGLVVGQE